MASKPRYDVYEFDEPAFELADLPHVPPDPNDTGTEIAHGVTAATAVELVGLPSSWVDRLEGHIQEFGLLSTGSLKDNYEVRRTSDE